MRLVLPYLHILGPRPADVPVAPLEHLLHCTSCKLKLDPQVDEPPLHVKHKVLMVDRWAVSEVRNLDHQVEVFEKENSAKPVFESETSW